MARAISNAATMNATVRVTTHANLTRSDELQGAEFVDADLCGGLLPESAAVAAAVVAEDPVRCARSGRPNQAVALRRTAAVSLRSSSCTSA